MSTEATTTLADLLGPEAGPVTFDHEGETYNVRAVDLATETAIGRFLRKRAYDALYADRDIMPPELYEDALAGLQRDRARYVFMGPEFWKVIRGADDGKGMAGLVSILLQTTLAKAEKLLKDRPADVAALVVETILSALPKEKEATVRQALRGERAVQGNGQTPPAA